MSKTTIELKNVQPKKNSIRFDAAPNQDTPVQSVYIGKKWTDQHGGCPKGVKITIEPIA
jgi:hypothetical protein